MIIQKKFLFIDELDTTLINKQDRNTSIIYRNYKSQTKPDLIKKIKNICRKKWNYNTRKFCKRSNKLYHFFIRKFTKVKISSSRNHSHYRYIIPNQGDEHVIQGLNNQLTLLGLKNFEDPDLSWMIKNFNKKVKKKYKVEQY